MGSQTGSPRAVLLGALTTELAGPRELAGPGRASHSPTPVPGREHERAGAFRSPDTPGREPDGPGAEAPGRGTPGEGPGRPSTPPRPQPASRAGGRQGRRRGRRRGPGPFPLRSSWAGLARGRPRPAARPPREAARRPPTGSGPRSPEGGRGRAATWGPARPPSARPAPPRAPPGRALPGQVRGVSGRGQQEPTAAQRLRGPVGPAATPCRGPPAARPDSRARPRPARSRRRPARAAPGGGAAPPAARPHSSARPPPRRRPAPRGAPGPVGPPGGASGKPRPARPHTAGAPDPHQFTGGSRSLRLTPNPRPGSGGHWEVPAQSLGNGPARREGRSFWSRPRQVRRARLRGVAGPGPRGAPRNTPPPPPRPAQRTLPRTLTSARTGAPAGAQEPCSHRPHADTHPYREPHTQGTLVHKNGPFCGGCGPVVECHP